MAIHDWPETERPRERLLQHGASALTDAELLAIFLRVGIAGRSAVDLARDLLAQFGGLRGLLCASQAELCQAKGMGPAKYAQLQATLELARRHLAEQMPERDLLSDPSLVRRYLQSQLRGLPHEVFLGLFLDSQNRLIAKEELAHGSLREAQVHPREVVKRALHHNAAALLVAHNHPSGVAEPSPADTAFTRQLQAALALIDVRLLDHFVVGEGLPVSLAERGLL
jgi:DNA repair protein RadC